MKKRIFFTFLLIATCTFLGISQNVAINATGASPDPCAILDLQSTTKGFLPPRMTFAERNAIPSPVAGLVVFNTTDNCLNVFQSGAWSGCLGQVSTQIPITRVYTANATWTKPAGLKYVVVRLVGGGGNGANAVNTTFGGAGGGGGGYSEKYISTINLGATINITVGSVAGTSSFGSHCQATGGASVVVNIGNGGSGGVGSNGDVNLHGEDGESNGEDHGGSGGSSLLGGGGRGGSRSSFGSINAASGHSYGGGGGGGCDGGLGAPGSPGVVIVTEYY